MKELKKSASVFLIIFALMLTGWGQFPIWAQDENESPDAMVRAQLRGVNSPILSSKIAGVITHLGLQSGDAFKKGQLLVEIDCKAQKTQLALAKVLYNKKSKIAKINERLHELGSSSELEMAMVKAEVEEAHASIQYNEAILKKCTIYAPFPGRVGDLFVERYQYVNEGDPIMQINENLNLEIEMIVPSLWLKWLRKKHPFELKMDETGKTYPATIQRIMSRVDPVSHTVKVYGLLERPAPELLPGMSGQVLIVPPVPGKKPNPKLKKKS